MYYLHYIRNRRTLAGPETLYAVMTKSVKRQGAIVTADFAEGPFRTRARAMVRARGMHAILIYNHEKDENDNA